MRKGRCSQHFRQDCVSKNGVNTRVLRQKFRARNKFQARQQICDNTGEILPTVDVTHKNADTPRYTTWKTTRENGQQGANGS